jgi:phosphatidate cytidylyltransferase
MTDLATRTFTAAFLVLIALMAAVLGGYYFALTVAAAATVLYYEWMRIVRGWGLGWAVGGFFYALAPALSLLWVRDRAEDGLALVLWTLLITWALDTGGYFAGRSFGGRKLAPSISPQKTWAGLYGGIALATVFSAAWVLATDLNWWLLLLAPLFAAAAQVGDLFESWMKRRAGLKDSGNWLPGHGGLFDRIDGLVPIAVLTFAAEVVGLV